MTVDRSTLAGTPGPAAGTRRNARDGLALWVRPSTVGALVALGCTGAAAAPQEAATPLGIYTCVDDQGRKLTSDRPIAECQNRDQRLLNQDGSVKRVVPPPMTADERAERELAELRAAEAHAAQFDAQRRDRNLKTRFPNEAAHHKAREAALDTARLAMRASDARLEALAAERKPLLSEVEFYKGRALPPRLKQQLDANDASASAQRALKSQQQAEMERINQLFDVELDRLRKLWAGAKPGSLGPVPQVGELVGQDSTKTPSTR